MFTGGASGKTPSTESWRLRAAARARKTSSTDASDSAIEIARGSKDAVSIGTGVTITARSASVHRHEAFSHTALRAVSSRALVTAVVTGRRVPVAIVTVSPAARVRVCSTSDAGRFR